MSKVASLILVAFLVAGCGGAAAPTRAADIEGTITNVGRQDDRVVSVLLEANPGERSGSGKAAVTLRADTRLLAQRSGSTTSVTAADLAVGQRVRAWFVGPIRESYPVQADAELILILAGE